MKKIFFTLFLSILGCTILAIVPMGIMTISAQEESVIKNKFDDILVKPDHAIDVKSTGAEGLKDIVIEYMKIAKDIVSIVAVLWIVISGMRMVMAGGKEDSIKNNFRSVLWLIVGLIVMQISESTVAVMYGENGVFKTLEQYGGEVSTEAREKIIEPLLQYFLSFLSAIAVVMVILSGFKIITAGGDDSKIKKQQQVLLWTVMGLGIILVARPIVSSMFGYEKMAPEPSKAVDLINQIANYMLGFTAVISVVILIYAGLMMIINFGNDQAVAKSKKMIQWVITGIVVMISAYTIVTTFIVPSIR